MNSLILILISLLGYLLSYRFYGRYLGRRLFKLSAEHLMPAHEFKDGVDFVPARARIIFGHHFTTIAGLGPIVGPAIGIIWGWLPAFLWVFLGSIFMGAVHDFSTLVVSARNKGRSIGELTGDIISPATRYAFQFIMQLLLFIVLAVFAMIVASLFVNYPEAVIPVWAQIPVAVWLGWKIRQGKNELIWSIVALLLLYAFVLLGIRFPVSLPWNNELSVVVWCVILFIYVFFASTIPVQKLLQPRDYINSHQLIVAMLFLILGICVAHPDFAAPAINETAFQAGSDVPDLAPVLFIVIACGAISGFHSLASSGTTVKQINSELDTLPVGYGAMITESFLAVLVIVAAGAGLGMGLDTEGGLLQGKDAYSHHYASWSSANGLSAKLDAFIIGSANLFSSLGLPVKYGSAFVVVFIVSFANTTLDSATRIQRISLQEIFTGRAAFDRGLSSREILRRTTDGESESPEGIDADDIAHYHHDQRANRNHQQHAVNGLGLYRQTVEREIDGRRASLSRLCLCNCNGIQVILLDRKVYLDVAATLDADEWFVAAPPDEESFRQVDLSGCGIEVQPAVAVVHLEPGNDLGAALSSRQRESMHHARRNSCCGKDHCHHVHESGISIGTGAQQLHVRVRRGIVHASQQFRCKGRGVG